MASSLRLSFSSQLTWKRNSVATMRMLVWLGARRSTACSASISPFQVASALTGSSRKRRYASNHWLAGCRLLPSPARSVAASRSEGAQSPGCGEDLDRRLPGEHRRLFKPYQAAQRRHAAGRFRQGLHLQQSPLGGLRLEFLSNRLTSAESLSTVHSTRISRSRYRARAAISKSSCVAAAVKASNASKPTRASSSCFLTDEIVAMAELHDPLVDFGGTILRPKSIAKRNRRQNPPRQSQRENQPNYQRPTCHDRTK